MKKRRHAKILELINSHDIETQEELQAFLLKTAMRLRKQQFPVILRNYALLRICQIKADTFIQQVRKIMKMQEEQAVFSGNQLLMLNTLKILFALNAFQVWLLPYALQLTQWNGQAS